MRSSTSSAEKLERHVAKPTFGFQRIERRTASYPTIRNFDIRAKHDAHNYRKISFLAVQRQSDIATMYILQNLFLKIRFIASIPFKSKMDQLPAKRFETVRKKYTSHTSQCSEHH